MKILSWNVNGLRAVHKKGNWDEFLKLNPDVFCLQETKAEPKQLPDEVRELKGYFSYFASSQTRKGYSGTAIYSKVEPESVTYGMGTKKFDQEGRLITAYFKDFILLCVYFPNGGGSPERFEYKLEFYDAFLEYIDTIAKEKRKPLIFCGDVNAAHEEIDLARPKENADHTNFLPEVREWVDEVIRHGYIDTYRHFNPEKEGAYSYWDMKSHARDRNVGWRIDYFFASGSAMPMVKNALILSDVYGSDHCPVGIELA